MFEAEFLIFCQQYEQTPSGVNLLGVSDMLLAEAFPMKPESPLQVVVWLRAKKPIYGVDQNAKLSVEFENKELFSSNLAMSEVKVLKDLSVPVQINLEDAVFERPGKYYFKFYIDDKLLITRLLWVRDTHDFAEK